MTIFQKPNPLLWTAIASFLVKFIIPTGPIHKFGDVVQTVSLVIWSYLELTHGVNWFRKILGGAVLLFIGVSLSPAYTKPTKFLELDLSGLLPQAA